MRRKDREITGRENIEPILQACKVCRVAMTGTDGWPYVIPMNFGYTWDEDGLTLYFHGGVKGKKIDSLRADPRICFELDCEEGLTGEGDLACRYSYAFSSIVGYGKVEFAKDNDEKRQGFDVIMQHQTGKGGWTYTDAALSVTEVMRVRAESFEASRKGAEGMSMKHIGTKILAGVLVVLLAGAGVLIWRNLPEDAPRLQEPEETVRQEPEVQPDTTATLCVAGDIVAHMPLVADAWNGETYDFTHLFADARRYYEAADYTTACLETTFNGPPYSGLPAVLRTG